MDWTMSSQNLRTTISTKKRVYQAMILRFIIGRYGRDNIGFMWTVMEPLVLCVGVMVIWTQTKGHDQHGVSVPAFVLTGYVPLTLWRHQTGYAVNMLSHMKFLTIFNQIKLFDAMMSRFFLEFVSVSAAFMLVQLVLMAFSILPEPYDYALLLQGWVLMGCLGTGVGILLASISVLTDVIEKVNGPFQYFLLPFCGAFYMVDWLPDSLQEYAVMLPMVHAYEMIRGGYFGPVVKVHYDAFYAGSWALFFAGVGCFLFERVRDRVE